MPGFGAIKILFGAARDAGIIDQHIQLAEMPGGRGARRPVAPPPVPERGYALLYRREILQADRGCDFNFLRKHPLKEGGI
jgi:dihydroxy-acid dehydratase